MTHPLRGLAPDGVRKSLGRGKPATHVAQLSLARTKRVDDLGSNCRPASMTSSSRAAAQPIPRRYGRSLVIASSASATANTRAPNGCRGRQAIGVAAAVPALVMRTHNAQPFAMQQGDTPEHLLAEKVCGCILRRSGGVSGPGFLRI